VRFKWFSSLPKYLCLCDLNCVKSWPSFQYFSSLVSSLNQNLLLILIYVAPISFCGFHSFSFLYLYTWLVSSQLHMCCSQIVAQSYCGCWRSIFLSLAATCAGNEVQCRDRTCVRGAKCDGRPDCADNSDEEGCRKDTNFVL
jgi:Low-density lipoprotein receptor domain class A